MASAKVKKGKTSASEKNTSSGPRNPEDASKRNNPDRPENKVPYADENIEHTIRRAMREKVRQRSKDPGTVPVAMATRV